MYKYLPTTEPFTGSRCFVDAEVMHPIRAKMGKNYLKGSKDNEVSIDKIVGGSKKAKKKGKDIIKKGVKGFMKILK